MNGYEKALESVTKLTENDIKYIKSIRVVNMFGFPIIKNEYLYTKEGLDNQIKNADNDTFVMFAWNKRENGELFIKKFFINKKDLH